MSVVVLRMGHRPERDKRVTTHAALVARAFGADGMLLSSEDKSIENTVNDVTERFGGPFFIETDVSWRKTLTEWKGVVVHLTMYGMPLDDTMKKITREVPLLVVIGAEKVPREVYERADHNIAVGNQPHSEIAALAMFLDRYQNGKALERKFDGAMRIIPSERGKEMVDVREGSSTIPSRKRCLALLRERKCPDNVIAHAEVVEHLAIAMAERLGANVNLVSAGALLHDIGRSKTHGPGHAPMGAKIAKKEGLDPRIVRIIERHLGAGVDEEDRQQLGFPPGIYMPETLEEKIVAHADSLIDDRRCGELDAIVKRLESLGYEKAARRVEALHMELNKMIEGGLDTLCRKIIGEQSS